MAAASQLDWRHTSVKEAGITSAGLETYAPFTTLEPAPETTTVREQVVTARAAGACMASRETARSTDLEDAMVAG